MPDSPAATARPERPEWFPEPARPTYDHMWEPDEAADDAYLEALDDYESKD